MSRHVISVRDDADLRDVADILDSQRIKRVSDRRRTQARATAQALPDISQFRQGPCVDLAADGDTDLEHELRTFAWAMARVPTHDLHGLQIKAGTYAQLRGPELLKPPQTVVYPIIGQLVRAAGCHSVPRSKSQIRLSRTASGIVHERQELLSPPWASWLNQVEGWFSILQGQSLTGASFTSLEQLKEHIDAFIQSYNDNAEPFVWTKSKVHQRRVKGRRLSDL
jgi:hypothetical protein